MRFEFGPRQVAIVALGTALYSVMNWLSASFQTVPGATLVFPATAVVIRAREDLREDAGTSGRSTGL